MEQNRSSFSGKLGFVLAAAGSAVGLGNIWRFPYLAAKYGGGIFLLVYIALAVTFGFALALTEIAIGRKTKLSPIGAFSSLNKKFSFIGILGSIVPIIILPYYSVIGGWVTKYFVGFVSGNASLMAGDSYFGDFIGSTGEPVWYFLIFIGLTALIVLLGVDKGIEKVSKIMMPALILLILIITGYSLFTLDGAWEGVVYYITPDFSKFSVMTVVAAMGQLFYSMSIAMGIMVTFGSYLKKDVSIEKSVYQIEFFDMGVAFLSALMIVPAVFAFSGGNEEAMSQKGAGLMFETLPKIFDTMPGGNIIGAIFFVMVFFAAITSSISLMETVVSTITDKFKLNRTLSCLVVFLGSAAIGLVSAFGYSIWADVKVLGMQFLDLFDFASNSVLMPIGAFATSIFVGYVLKPKSIIAEVEGLDENGKPYHTFRAKKMYSIIIKYIAPVCILLILISSVLDALGIVKI
ncbi:MAG: sodium-dependent transporter [Clostridia bacterium]|nr:sodium-dependent transporter [Clostridia bacterium]